MLRAGCMITYFEIYQPMKKYYGCCIAPVMEQYHMTRAEVDIMLFLANNPEYDTAKEIIEVRGMTKSQTSSSVAALISRGYLAGSFQNGDRKTVHLMIQDAAEEMIHCGQEAQKRFQQSLEDGLTPEELNGMKHCLHQFEKNIRSRLEAEA